MIPSAETRAAPANHAPSRVLIVEDNPRDAELLRVQLDAALGENAEVLHAATLAEGLRALGRGDIHLTLLDLDLPDSAGLDTLERIKAAADCPVIVVTGNDDPDVLRGALAKHAYEALPKSGLDREAIGRLVRRAAEQQRTERALREAKRRFRTLFENAADAIFVHRAGRIVLANPAMARMLGAPSEAKLVGSKALNIIAPEFRAVIEERRALMERGESVPPIELEWLRRDGGRIVVEAAPSLIDFDGAPAVQVVARDVTERRHAEQTVRRLGRMYQTISASNEAILRAKTPEELLLRICEIATEHASFLRAMARMVDRGTGMADVVAFSGPDVAQFTVPVSVREDHPLGRGLVGIAFRSGRPAIARDFHADPRTVRWHRSAAHMGTKSVGAFPLRRGGECVGVLLLHGAEHEAFDGEMQALLERMAENVSFALENMEREVRLGESEARFRSLTELSTDMYWEQDEQYRFVALAGKSPEWLRKGRLQMIGKRRWDQTYINMSAADWAAHKADLEARRPFKDLELCRLNDAGEKVWVSVSGEPVFDAAGTFRGYRGIGRDITTRKRGEDLLRLEHAVARAIAEAEDAASALKTVMRAMCETEGWDCGRYFAWDEQAGALVFREFWHVPKAALEIFIARSRELTYAPGVGLIGRVLQSGQPLWVTDLAKDSRVKAGIAREAGMHGAFLFAVMSEGKPIGVLSFHSREVREPDERLLQAVRVIGGQIGQFVQRKQAEEELRRFRLALDSSADMIVLIDRATMRFVDVNSTVCRLLGYTREEMLGMGPQDVLPASREELERAYDELIADPSRKSGMKSHYRRKDGSLLPFESTRRVLRSGDGYLIAAISRDITERTRSEEAMRRLGNMYAALSASNEAISRLREERALFQRVCELAVQYGGAKLAAIRLIDRATLWVEPVAFAGEPHWYLEKARVSIDPTRPEGRGPAALALSEGRSIVIDDFMADPRLAPWKDVAGAAGIGSAANIPLWRGGEVVGLLTLYAEAADWFDPELLKLVERLAGNLSLALDNLDREAQRLEAEARLRESEARFRSLSELGSDWFWETDAEHRFTNTPNRVTEITSLTANSYVGKRRWEVEGLSPESGDWSEHRRVLERREAYRDLTLLQIRTDGSRCCLQISGEPVYDADGKFKGYRGTAKDITARKQTEQRLKVHAARQQAVAEFGQYALGKPSLDELYAGAVQRVCDGGAGAAALYEWVAADERFVLRGARGMVEGAEGRVATRQELAALDEVVRSGASRCAKGPELQASADSTQPGRFESAVYAPIFGNGHATAVLAAFSSRAGAFGDEDRQFLESVASVVSTALHRQNAEQRLAQLAQFDPLTGLPNRNLLGDRLAQTLVQAKRKQWKVGVLFIDLDRFKLVNDTLGHQVGDALIAQVGERLSACVRSGDTVGRNGGDEFVAVLSDLAHPDDAALVARKILDSLAKPFLLAGNEAFVSASIGIAIFPGDGEDADTLLKNADVAMYRAKKNGRNAYRFFKAQMNERSAAKMRLNTELRHAIERREFRLHYQPKLDLESKELVGLEALLRWQHPERGLVSPMEFVPVLEDSGLILPVGEWVLGEACAQLRRWQREGLEPVPVAVNLSAKQFRRRDIDALVERALEAAGVPANLLELEITESSLMDDPEDAVRALAALKARGVKISIDDFGTGYSSLAYLTRLPVSALKIDRAFVRDAHEREDAAAVVRAIIEMAHSLRFSVVAEGVETERQAGFLLRHGCDQAQGYLYARPEPAEQAAARLRRSARAA